LFNNLNLSLFVCIIFLIGGRAIAEDALDTIDQGHSFENSVAVLDSNTDHGLVQILTKPVLSTPYRERRSGKSYFFEINADNYYPSDYTSKIDNQFFDVMYGSEDLTILQVEAGLQFNMSFGSLAFSLQYGKGSLEDDRLGSVRTIEVSKPAFKMAYQMDTLWDEPYAVPYVGLDLWKMSFAESLATTQTASFDTGIGMTYRAGVLLQLNWLDHESALTSYQDIGLQNTYLDLSINQYADSQNDSDPSTFSDYNWAAGLRMEF